MQKSSMMSQERKENDYEVLSYSEGPGRKKTHENLELIDKFYKELVEEEESDFSM